MSKSSILRRAGLAAAVCAVSVVAVATSEAAPGDHHFHFSTKSKDAEQAAHEIVRGIESFEIPTKLLPLAQKAIAADPEFAMGYYFMATFSPTPEEQQKNGAKAIELAKNASEGERRYMEAVFLVRQQKPADALPILIELEKRYPGERMVHMMLGQVLMNQGKYDESLGHFQHAIKLDGSTPRAHTFVGNIALLRDDYARARDAYTMALTKKVPNTAPFGPYTGLAFSYVYERRWDDAVKVLETFRDEYIKVGNNTNFPEVWIWNAIGRVQLEAGRADRALECYRKGFESVPGSKIDDQQKMIWKGRLLHGTGRSLAKLGKHDEAWKEADVIKKMIEEGGDAGKEFWPAYHYIAGYLKFEAGDFAGAIEHMKQSDLTDPFHMLVLARAFEKTGNAAEAAKLYKQIVDFTQSNMERALSYPEAKSKLKA